jgi:pheromone shutdown protein TraB
MYYTRTARKRHIRQFTCGLIALVAMAACVCFFIGYAMAHDHFAPWEVQTVLLCATVIALATAIISILIGYENL